MKEGRGLWVHGDGKQASSSLRAGWGQVWGWRPRWAHANLLKGG